MKNYTAKQIYEECEQSGFFYPRVTLRVWFVEIDDSGRETDRGCMDFSSKERKFSTSLGAQNFIATQRASAERFANSMYPEAIWNEEVAR